jgi:riboflavin kinase/FMN adenylyltransferase
MTSHNVVPGAMARIVSLAEAPARPRRIALGNFDGVHRGHRQVVAGADAVVTFDPHPKVVVHPGHHPRVLTSLRRRAELLGAMGVSELIVVPFDRRMMSCSATSFVDEVLLNRLGVVHVSVGENCRFGHAAAGDAAMLAADDRFETRIVPLLEVAGDVVSSTRVRELLASGSVERASTLLGSPFVLDGRVEGPCSLRPRALSVQLAPGRLSPAAGIYDCQISVGPDGPRHARVALEASAGDAPAREGSQLTVGPLPVAAIEPTGAEIRIEFRRRAAEAATKPSPRLAPVSPPSRCDAVLIH